MDQLSDHFFVRVDNWLFEALHSEDRHRAAAAQSNLMKALRSTDGQDAALITIGENPMMTRAYLPRLWALRQTVVEERRRAG